MQLFALTHKLYILYAHVKTGVGHVRVRSAHHLVGHALDVVSGLSLLCLRPSSPQQ